MGTVPSHAFDISPELAGWSTRRPVTFQAAVWWAQRGFRARSWLPRQVGRLLGTTWRVLVPVGHKAYLAVDSRNLDLYTSILREGGWEEDVVRTCAAALHPGDVFYDVGASAGYISIALADAFAGQLRVVAFEPQPSLACRIRVSAGVSGFDDVDVLEDLVGPTEGDATLFVPAHSVHASLVPRARRTVALERKMRTLDGLVAGLPPPDVIKLDVEGGELGVLQGAENLLRTHRPYVVFEADDNMSRFGYGFGDLAAAFPEVYSFHGITHGGLVPLDDSSSGVRDVLAQPRSRASLTPDDLLDAERRIDARVR